MAVNGVHWNDVNGNPSGGVTQAEGLLIAWQNGPLKCPQTGNRLPRNGAFVEEVIEAVMDRFNVYQDSQFNCPENAKALYYLQLALDACRKRTRNRVMQGVEGTHGVHDSLPTGFSAQAGESDQQAMERYIAAFLQGQQWVQGPDTPAMPQELHEQMQACPNVVPGQHQAENVYTGDNLTEEQRLSAYQQAVDNANKSSEKPLLVEISRSLLLLSTQVQHTLTRQELDDADSPEAWANASMQQMLEMGTPTHDLVQKAADELRADPNDVAGMLREYVEWLSVRDENLPERDFADYLTRCQYSGDPDGVTPQERAWSQEVRTTFIERFNEGVGLEEPSMGVLVENPDAVLGLLNCLINDGSNPYLPTVGVQGLGDADEGEFALVEVEAEKEISPTGRERHPYNVEMSEQLRTLLDESGLKEAAELRPTDGGKAVQKAVMELATRVKLRPRSWELLGELKAADFDLYSAVCQWANEEPDPRPDADVIAEQQDAHTQAENARQLEEWEAEEREYLDPPQIDPGTEYENVPPHPDDELPSGPAGDAKVAQPAAQATVPTADPFPQPEPPKGTHPGPVGPQGQQGPSGPDDA